MAKIQVSADKKTTLEIVQAAISAGEKRLKIGLDTTERRIVEFERKYNRTSSEFLQNMSAEDLEGGDDEYVAWLGELKIRERILEDIDRLQSVEYVTH